MMSITTVAEAERAIEDASALIGKLSTLMEEETSLVHGGRVSRLAALAPEKSELSRQLFAAHERLKANAAFLLRAVPARCATLRHVQDGFRAVLQKNLMVLATTHAVSEGIVRRLSSDLARKRAPQVYGASGKTAAPSSRFGQPLALSRKL